MKLSKNQQTLDQIAPLVEYAFSKNYDVRKDHNFMTRYYHSDSYGELHDHKLESYVMVNHFQSQIFDKKVKMAGVGYVASYPENRGHGDITKIMREILQDLHHEGVALSNLAPWSETFYRQYGYENAVYQKNYDIKPTMFRFFRSPKKGKILRGRWNDSEISKMVLALYRKQMNSGEERNTVIREKWWWDRFVTYYPGRFTAVYINENNEPQAYMFYRIHDNQFVAEELYSTSENGAKAMLNFIGSHISSCDHFKLIMSEESMIEEYFPDQERITITVRPYMMSRVVDFAKIASCMKLMGGKSVILEVTEDQNCPWNNGAWKIVSENGIMQCKKTSDLANFKGSIINWTKVLVGHLTLRQSIRLGLIKEIRPTTIDFKKGKVSFYDYF